VNSSLHVFTDSQAGPAPDRATWLLSLFYRSPPGLAAPSLARIGRAAIIPTTMVGLLAGPYPAVRFAVSTAAANRRKLGLWTTTSPYPSCPTTGRRRTRSAAFTNISSCAAKSGSPVSATCRRCSSLTARRSSSGRRAPPWPITRPMRAIYRASIIPAYAAQCVVHAGHRAAPTREHGKRARHELAPGTDGRQLRRLRELPRPLPARPDNITGQLLAGLPAGSCDVRANNSPKLTFNFNQILEMFHEPAICILLIMILRFDL
jgi:hypothetical protein